MASHSNSRVSKFKMSMLRRSGMGNASLIILRIQGFEAPPLVRVKVGAEPLGNGCKSRNFPKNRRLGPGVGDKTVRIEVQP
jgi:hypothetical protein